MSHLQSGDEGRCSGEAMQEIQCNLIGAVLQDHAEVVQHALTDGTIPLQLPEEGQHRIYRTAAPF